MTNSTDEFWDVDGTSLNTLVQNLRSWGGSREAPAPLRGSNQVIPFSPGAIFVEKVPDQRTIVLDGWMTDRSATVLKQRWREFRALLWRPDEQFGLTRRWRDAQGNLVAATTLAEYDSGLEPIVTSGGTRYEFKINLTCEPFFYGDEISQTLAVGSNAFSLKGDYATRKVTVQFLNALTAPRVNAMRGTSIDNWVEYPSLVSGAVATLDVERFRAEHSLSGSTTKVSGKVTHGGAIPWLDLHKKITVLRFDRPSGSGSAVVKYRPAWH